MGIIWACDFDDSNNNKKDVKAGPLEIKVKFHRVAILEKINLFGWRYMMVTSTAIGGFV